MATGLFWCRCSANRVKLDGQSQDSFLQSTNLRRIFGLRAQLLSQPVDLHRPPILMRLFPKFGPLGAREMLLGGSLRGAHPPMHFGHFGGDRRCGRHDDLTRLLAPDLKDARSFSNGAEAFAKLTAQPAPADGFSPTEQFSAGSANAVFGQAVVHAG